MLVKYLRYTVKNYLFAVLAMIFSLLYWLSSKDLPSQSTDFPRALFLIIIPLIVWNLAMSIVGFRKQLAAETPEAEKWECSLNITKPKVVVTIATIIYVFVLPIVGFVVTTAVYLALLSFYLGTRKPLKLILFAVLYTAALYGVFVAWLGVRMPAGFLI